MNIRFKKIGKQYAFDVLDKESKVIYASNLHYFLTPHVQSGYRYAWEACRDAYKLIFKRPYHLFAARDDMTDPIIIDVSAEQMLINHYMNILEGIREQVGGMEDNSKERDYLYKSIKIIEGELNKIIETLTDHKAKKSFRIILSRLQRILKKHFRQEENKEEHKTKNLFASSALLNKTEELLDPHIKKDIMENYAHEICRVIQDKHSGAYYVIDSSCIKVMDENNQCILQVSTNENINIVNIIPCGSLRKIYPFRSCGFYQKYWKPIVEAIGHVVIEDPPVLIVPEAITLPDVPKERADCVIKGWHTKNQEEQPLEISFNNDMWSIAPSKTKMAFANSSKYTEHDYKESIVKCIDAKLDSIYNRTGVVLQVIPHTDIIEIDVDFGRGLGTIRLTEKQVEIISV